MEKSRDCRTYKKWMDTIYGINMAIYVDILLPVKRISVTMRQEIHNPVEVICRIKGFMTIVKLVIIFDDAVSKEESHLPVTPD